MDLSKKDITFIPPELYTLDKLEVLDLSNNKQNQAVKLRNYKRIHIYTRSKYNFTITKPSFLRKIKRISKTLKRAIRKRFITF